MKSSVPTAFADASSLVLFAVTLSLSPTVRAQVDGSEAGRPDAVIRQTSRADHPNRTLPKVAPPKTGLEFSAKPTTQEISRARVFEEPLVPIGAEPGEAENAALAVALLAYAKQSGPDDFASLTGFLEKHPQSPWRAALLTCLGLEYYNTAYYSLALEAWSEAWSLGQKAGDAQGKFLADRAACELAGLYSRLGRMTELEALLKSVEQRVFLGGATERINMAREALSMMQHQPGISFRCGPLALQSIKRSLDPQAPIEPEILNSASTQQGFSLPQVAELSKKVGLNYRMAFRGSSKSEIRNPKSEIEFVVPSVLHWKVGHYAAIVRRVGDRYLVEDPTFGNTVWATKQALEAETSGYFLIAPGELPRGWRSVDAKEGGTVWGKGVTTNNDPDAYTPDDLGTCPIGNGTGGNGTGMAVSSVHLMLANLQIRDTPVGYTPPVGPSVQFTLRYNHRDYLAGPVSSIFGPKWTHDWFARITDDPANPLADVKYFVGGGGARTFTGFNTNTQTFAPQLHDQTLLKRTVTNTYEMIFPDGSKKIFGLRSSTSLVLLTQVVDPAGNAVTLTYEEGGISLPIRLAAITDALGQVTTISYEHSSGDLITKVTDPFGRFASFEYGFYEFVCGYTYPNGFPEPIFCRVYILSKITDVLGLESRFVYSPEPFQSDIIQQMITPYGTNTFVMTRPTPAGPNARAVETIYPDGSRDRVEFNQSNQVGPPFQEPLALVPVGMATYNGFLYGRNTYYWSREACATSYRDYSKAKIYHWLHRDLTTATAAGILESVKEPLEHRVWYNYAGQSGPVGPAFVGANNRPTHIGRVLEDGQTQLYTNAYNAFGHVTSSVDPVGRKLSFIYAPNGIDLLEVRQTRAGNNELLFRATYNAQHRPLTVTDAAGQTSTFTYNARAQRLTATNPKGETISLAYDPNGYLMAVDGPLAGTNDSVAITYDAFGRTRTLTDASGYRLSLEYDLMDRLTSITHPDSTFSEFTYDRLDLVTFRDRAGRQTLLEYDEAGQMRKQTDPLGRMTLFDWCRCGDLKSLSDPMGRTTSWLTDVQGRPIGKQYADGSQVTYLYENASSRLHQVIDEKQQVTQFTWNRDDTIKSIAYANTAVPTPGVSFTYDPNYERVISMTDGAGSTFYSYHPVTGTPTLGAGALASVDGPLPNDTTTYAYDELGRSFHRAIHGVGATMTFDAAGRLVGLTNALGAFAYAYDGSSLRLVSKSLPNGQTEERSYGNNLQDRTLQRITHQIGATPLSEFLYGHDVPANRIATWSQQASAQSPALHTFGYDLVNQLLSASVTNAGNLVNTFAYTYDPIGNRVNEQVGASNYTATYNALNQVSTTTAPGTTRSNEWDALDRLVAVNAGNQRTEFTYDGLSRMVGIRQLLNGSEVSHRRFVWCRFNLCEERDAAGVVTKRFFPQGMKVESGPLAGTYFYTRDHLGSVRELIDSSGTVRARYAYDPYGRRSKLTGDVEADFGFAGMFWSAEANLSLTHFRAYDPELGRWLSRDPLKGAEVSQGPNLYAYVHNNPINRIDPLGLSADPFGIGPPLPCLTTVDCACLKRPAECAIAGLGAAAAGRSGTGGGAAAPVGGPPKGGSCASAGGVPKVPTRPPPAEPMSPITRADSQPSLPAARVNVHGKTQLEPPALAKTHAAETTTPNEALPYDWLRDTLNRTQSMPGYELFPAEHTRQITLGIIERHKQLLELQAARAEIAEWLAGLPGL